MTLNIVPINYFFSFRTVHWHSSSFAFRTVHWNCPFLTEEYNRSLLFLQYCPLDLSFSCRRVQKICPFLLGLSNRSVLFFQSCQVELSFSFRTVHWICPFLWGLSSDCVLRHEYHYVSVMRHYDCVVFLIFTWNKFPVSGGRDTIQRICKYVQYVHKKPHGPAIGWTCLGTERHTHAQPGGKI